jgi:hypothetical protein
MAQPASDPFDDALKAYADTAPPDTQADPFDQALKTYAVTGKPPPATASDMSDWERSGQTAVGAAKEVGGQIEGAAKWFGKGVVRNVESLFPGHGQTPEEALALGKKAGSAAGSLAHAVAHPVETYSAAREATSRWMDRALTQPNTPEQAQERGRALVQGAEVVVPAVGAIGDVARVGGAFFKGGEAAAAVPEAAASVDNAQSIGAAHIPVDLTKAAPEIQAKVADANTAGVPVNNKALRNHVVAESLPVPIRLTRGQATEDGQLIAEENNSRNIHKEIGTRLEDNNAALTQNLDAVREKIGPDVHADNAHDYGHTIIEGYKEFDAPKLAEANAAYDEFKAGMAQNPGAAIDAKTLFEDAVRELHAKGIYEDAIAGIPAMKTLARLAETGEMTAEQYESLRSNLARVQRSHYENGNIPVAAGVIRGATEKLPLTGQAAALKPMADRARSLWKARQDAMDADPAYRAAVEGTVTPDKYVQTFITGRGPASSVEQARIMRQNLAGHDAASQAMSVSALDELVPAAGKAFSQSAYRSTLQGMEPKLKHLFRPEDQETLENLGEAARLVQQRPISGQTYVSQSVPMGRQMLEKAKDAAATAATVKSGGMLPVHEIRGYFKERAAKKESAIAIKRSLERGAGITE